MSKVLYEKRGEVAYITLNRPEAMNAIDLETHQLQGKGKFTLGSRCDGP